MKRKRPLIKRNDMWAIIALARKRAEMHERPVFVAELIRDYFGPDRKITNQMRKIVSAELDRHFIPRARRIDSPVTFADIAIEANRGRIKFDSSYDHLIDSPAESIPSALGGLTKEDSEIINVDFEIKPDRYKDLDYLLSMLSDRGDERAHALLLRRLGAL